MKFGFRQKLVLVVCLVCLALAGAASAQKYKSFRVAIYIPVGVVNQMKDPAYLENSWNTISSQMNVDKVYIESYRSRVVADEDLLEKVKKFFTDHGVQVAGGIAWSDAGGAGQFVTHAYIDRAERDYVKKIMQMTARHFDEIILDDFFFHMSKSDEVIAAKGKKSWTQFRLDLMDEVSKDLLLKPAREGNPKVRIIIKFPNWYEHFQGLGYDLDKEPKLFDGIYTGTETRDPNITDQHLQQYESYQIIRYFENIKPGGNGGGWVDTFSVRYVDRYAEQLWDTVFAKAREMMLFNWAALTQGVRPGARDAWKDLHTSFDFDQMVASHSATDGSSAPTMARVAGYALEQADPIVAQLGNPIGIKSYKPYQSTGEDFLHNWLGMIGIPIDLYPYFPTDASTVLLTESAKFDPDIVKKMEGQLKAGKNVVITSGLLRALQGHGIEDIVELQYTDHKAMVDSYLAGYGAGNGTGVGEEIKPILFPEIEFLTNDAWPLVRGQSSGNGYPILLMDHYSKGTLYVLTVPENFSDLYNMPQNVLTTLRNYIMGDFPVRLDAPAQVSLFAYDNNSFIVESFLDKPTDVVVSISGGVAKLKNLATGEEVAGEEAATGPFQLGAARERFKLTLQPHSYLAFAEEK